MIFKKNQHIKRIKRMAKTAIFTLFVLFFVSFFTGKNVINSILPYFDSDYELVEELGENDIEEKENGDIEDKENNLKLQHYHQLSYAQENSSRTAFIKNAKTHTHFHQEIPVPPPEHSILQMI